MSNLLSGAGHVINTCSLASVNNDVRRLGAEITL